MIKLKWNYIEVFKCQSVKFGTFQGGIFVKKKVEKMIALIMCAVMLICIAPLSGLVSAEEYYVNSRFHVKTQDELNAMYNNNEKFILFCFRQTDGNSQFIWSKVITEWCDTYEIDIYGTDVDASGIPMFVWNAFGGGSISLPVIVFVDGDDVTVYPNSGGTTQLKSQIEEKFFDFYEITPPEKENITYRYKVTYHQSEARTMLTAVNTLRLPENAWAWDETDTEQIYYSDLQPLVYDYDLEIIAMQRAAEIVARYAHERPNGEAPWSAYNVYGACGENIAYGFTTADGVETAWEEENDPYAGQGHRRNLLGEYFGAIGIACAEFNGRKFWVQEFRDIVVEGTQTPANDSLTEVSVELAKEFIQSKTLVDSGAVTLTLDAGSTANIPAFNYKVKMKTDPYYEIPAEYDPAWTCADTSVATVSGNVITGVSAGETYISTTTDEGEIRYSVKVNAVVPDVLTYEITGGKVTITGCDKNASGELVIPGTIEGCPVTSIGETAFFECTRLTDITIPDSVVSIGSWAFENCNSLTSITIPDSVTSINNFAFQSCYALSSITVEEGNTKYHSAGNCLIETESKTLIAGCKNSVIPDDGSVKEIGISAFYCCFELTDIIIPDSVESIGWSAFQSCESLTSVTIGNGVKTIEDNAFLSCTGLTSITIPDSVTSISCYSFYGCNGLSDITVSEGNEKYHSAGNCLIETASKTLLLGCKNSVIPDDGSVTSINENAFGECVGLTSITIPDSVTSIGYGAFEYCYGLTDVYFSGSEEEWNAIVIGEGNDCLTNATIHFNHEHSYTSETTVTQTCTVDGEITYTCECGDTYTEVVPSAGHKPASPVKENIVPATFTESGSYDEVVYCSVCSQELSRKTVVTPKEAFISGEIDKTAVVRGNQGVWTVKTTDAVEWLRFNGTYTTSAGNTFNSSVYFKAANYMNATEGVTVSDNNGERTWTIPMTFNFSGVDETVKQTWSVTYKVKNSSVWVDSPYSQEITVGKTEQSISPKPEGYAQNTLVVASCDFTEIGKGNRGDITIVTTIDCNKVRVTYTDAATGKTKASTFQTTSKSNVSFTDDETTGLRTWTIGYKFAAPAKDNEFRIDTRGVEWTEAKTVNVEVK